MPQAVSLVLANGEVTPVNHTFAPLGQDRETGFWWFEDQSPRVTSTSSLGWPRIGIRVRRANGGGPGDNAQTRINRVEYSIAIPQLETLASGDSGLTPPPTIAYVDRAKGEFLLPSRDSIADRQDVLAFNAALMADATLAALVEDLQQLY